MRVLVTGCSGTLGAATANALVRAEHQVLAVVHRRPLPATVDAAVVAVPGAMHAVDQLPATLGDLDAVVHCAFDWRRDPPGHFERANVDGALALLRMAAQRGARRFVQVSSVMAYGLAIDRAAQPVDEATPLVTPAAALDRYATVKASLEQRLRHAATAGACQVTAVRPGLIFTDTTLPLVRAVGPGRRRAALVAGTGRNHLPYIHVDDVADLIARIVRAPGPGEAYNATPSRHQPTAAVARAWLAARGARPLVVPVRTLPIEAAVVTSAAVRALRQRRWQAPNLRYGRTRTNRDITYSNARARNELGWEDTMTNAILRGDDA